MAGLFGALREIAVELPLIFPVHPRTANALERSGWGGGSHRLRLVKPLGYLDFLQLVAHARMVITDSGGIQEETTILQVPCLTVRETTERPITVTCGWNRLVGTRPDVLVSAARGVLAAGARSGQRPALWDGKASQRIVDVLVGEGAGERLVLMESGR